MPFGPGESSGPGDTTAKIWATADGGATWTTTTFPHLASAGFAGRDGSLIRVFGNGDDGPVMITSSDGGVTWTAFPVDGDPTDCR